MLPAFTSNATTSTHGSAAYIPRSSSLNIKDPKRPIYTTDIYLGLNNLNSVKNAAKHRASPPVAYIPPEARADYSAAYEEKNGKPIDPKMFDYPRECWHELGFSNRDQLLSQKPYLNYSRTAIQNATGTSFFGLGGFDAATHFKHVLDVETAPIPFGGNYDEFAARVPYGAVLEGAGPRVAFTGLELHDYFMGACKDKPFVPIAADGTFVDREALALAYKEAYTLACSKENKEHYKNTGELMPAVQAAAAKFQALIGGAPKLLVAPTDKKVFPPEE